VGLLTADVEAPSYHLLTRTKKLKSHQLNDM
jgi:hypothetical protein